MNARGFVKIKMKLILPVVVVLAMALFYLHIVANRYSPHTGCVLQT